MPNVIELRPKTRPKNSVLIKLEQQPEDFFHTFAVVGFNHMGSMGVANCTTQELVEAIDTLLGTLLTETRGLTKQEQLNIREELTVPYDRLRAVMEAKA